MFGLVALYQGWNKGNEAVELAEETVVYATQLGDQSQVLRARRNLAHSLELVHDYVRALAILDEALELSPDDPVTLATKGDLLVSMGQYQSAVTIYDQALKLDENNSSIWQLRGWALQYQGPSHLDAALASYEKATALKPDNMWAQKGIGNMLRLTGRPQEAKEKFLWIVDQMLAAEKVDEADYSLLSWCYYSLGNYEEALQYLTWATNRDFEVISDHFDLALCNLCLGKEEEAVEQYKQVLTRLRQRQTAARFDPLTVALTDLIEAKDFLPSLRESPAVQTIQSLLEDALQEITAA
jgi:tetratricopeptide (TPR) repeat protein